MINVNYDRPTNTHKVELEKTSIFKSDELPLLVKFSRTVTGEVAWSAELGEGGWVSWKGGSTPHDVQVITSAGKPVYYWTFDAARDGDQIEKTLWHFIARKSGSKGMVIGSHDGLFGHWVFPVIHGLTDAILVDGTESSIEAAKKNYHNDSHYNDSQLRFIKEIITPDGKPVEWYTGGEGYTDTIVKSVIAKFLPEDKIIKHELPSKSVKQLMQDLEITHLDWLHLDVEGLDIDHGVEEIP